MSDHSIFSRTVAAALLLACLGWAHAAWAQDFPASWRVRTVLTDAIDGHTNEFQWLYTAETAQNGTTAVQVREAEGAVAYAGQLEFSGESLLRAELSTEVRGKVKLFTHEFEAGKPAFAPGTLISCDWPNRPAARRKAAGSYDVRKKIGASFARAYAIDVSADVVTPADAVANGWLAAEQSANVGDELVMLTAVSSKSDGDSETVFLQLWSPLLDFWLYEKSGPRQSWLDVSSFLAQ